MGAIGYAQDDQDSCIRPGMSDHEIMTAILNQQKDVKVNSPKNHQTLVEFIQQNKRT